MRPSARCLLSRKPRTAARPRRCSYGSPSLRLSGRRVVAVCGGPLHVAERPMSQGRVVAYDAATRPVAWVRQLTRGGPSWVRVL